MGVGFAPLGGRESTVCGSSVPDSGRSAAISHGERTVQPPGGYRVVGGRVVGSRCVPGSYRVVGGLVVTAWW